MLTCREKVAREGEEGIEDENIGKGGGRTDGQWRRDRGEKETLTRVLE